MKEPRAVVAIIDDDKAVREALEGLLETVALKADLFGSVEEFLKSGKSRAPNCIVLDVRLPGPSGLDFQAQLASANNHTPIVFITGHGDIPTSVRRFGSKAEVKAFHINVRFTPESRHQASFRARSTDTNRFAIPHCTIVVRRRAKVLLGSRATPMRRRNFIFELLPPS